MDALDDVGVRAAEACGFRDAGVNLYGLAW